MFFLYQSKIDYKNFDVYEQLDRLDDDVLQSLLLTLLDLKNRKKRIGETGHEKYFKTTAINILIDSMNTKEKEDLVNLLLQSIMRDRNRLGPK